MKLSRRFLQTLNVLLKPVESKRILTLDDIAEDIREHTFNSKKVKGIAQWHRFHLLNNYLSGFRMGELSVFTGPTGCGKTTFLCEYSLDLCLQNVSTLWCSFEIPIGRLFAWMVKQFAKPAELHENRKELFEENFAKMTELLNNKMFVMNRTGSSKIENVISDIKHHYESSNKNLHHVVVDNLQFMQNKFRGSAVDKYSLQDSMFSEFRTLATELNIHVSLVIHPRKELEQELDINSLYGGVKASQEADNVFIIQKVTRAKQEPPFQKFLQIHKNRNVGELVQGNTILMKFDPKTKSHELVNVQDEKTKQNAASQPSFSNINRSGYPTRLVSSSYHPSRQSTNFEGR